MTPREGPIAAQRARNVLIRESVERLAGAVAVSGHDHPIPVAVVPANTRQTEPVPTATRDIFLNRMRETLDAITAAEARVMTGAEAASGGMNRSGPPRTDAMVAILGRSCATCRGECCTAGGNHAFLRRDSMERIRREQTSLDDAALLATYDAHIAERHYRGSCLFHATTGCTLPRTLRSDLCNRYVCGGLTQLTTALEATGGTTAFVGAADSVHLRRLALVDADRTTPIPLA